MTANAPSDSALTRSRRLRPGVYAPIPTFFLPESEELDLPALKEQVLRVATAGVGIVLSGSLGEGHHLSHDERQQIIRAARHTLDSAEPSLSHVPIVAGTGAGSTKETLQLTNEAAEAGADVAIVIASGYFADALDRQALKDFWTTVSEKSPIPVIVYNFPRAAGGLDLDSDLLEELARESSNLAGVKLTCGNIGKLTRLAAAVSSESFLKAHPRRNPNVPFLVLGGYSDFLVPALFANGHGAITGLANIAPYTLRRLFDISMKALQDASALAEAQELQGVVARADRTIAVTGIAGTKDLLQRIYGYGGVPRRPLRGFPSDAGENLRQHPNVVDLLKTEQALTLGRV